MPDEDPRNRLPDGNSPVLRYAFAATFIAACLYDLELGVRVAGVFLAGLSIYQGLLGRVPLIGVAWKTTGYLTGAAASVVSAAVIFISMFLIFEPRWAIEVVQAMHGETQPNAWR
jgi:hypothetical protein